jgi:MFS family permease
MPGGALSDRIGRRRTIQCGWLIYAAIYAGFGYATEASHIWILFGLYGIYFGLTEGAEKAFVADLVPSDLRSTAYGIHGFALGIAALPASVVMGLIWEGFGAGTAFLYGSGLSLVAAVLIGRVREGQEVREG